MYGHVFNFPQYIISQIIGIVLMSDKLSDFRSDEPFPVWTGSDRTGFLKPPFHGRFQVKDQIIDLIR